MTLRGIRIRRPMLACPLKGKEQVPLPTLLSNKYDGIRALVLPGKGLVSRKLKPIPNEELRALFGQAAYLFLDGELIAGSPTAPDCYHRTEKVVMTRKASASGVKFYVFDLLGSNPSWLEQPYRVRYAELRRVAAKLYGVKVVQQRLVRTPYGLRDQEGRSVQQGYEGAMARHPEGPYKQGRATAREGWLIKVKRFEDSEARVLGVYPRKKNTNKQERDERGYAKRSTHKAGKVATKLLGGFHCRDLKTGVEFDCGTGVLKRHELTMEGWVGTVIKYRFQPAGVKEKPRYPRFVGKRKRRDR